MTELNRLLFMFKAFEEHYIKKNFGSHNIHFDNSQQEIEDIIRAFGSYIIENGGTFRKNFPVSYEKEPENKEELNLAVNAVHRLKTTYEHRGEGEALVTTNEQNQTIRFQNRFTDLFSDFELDVTVPSKLLNRLIPSYFENYLHTVSLDDKKKMERCFSPMCIQSLNRRKERVEEEDLIKKYGWDKDKTFVYFHPTVMKSESRSLTDTIQTICDKVSETSEVVESNVFLNGRIYDVISTQSYGKYRIVDIYEIKRLKSIPFVEDKERNMNKASAKELGLTTLSRYKYDIVHLFIELNQIPITKIPHCEYLDLTPFLVKLDNNQYLQDLENFWRLNERYIQSFQDMRNQYQTMEHPKGKEAKKNALRRMYLNYYKDVFQKIGQLNQDVLLHLRNALSHNFIEDKKDYLLFYDGQSFDSDHEFELSGNIQDFIKLKEYLNGEKDYGKEDYNYFSFLNELLHYSKQHLLINEKISPNIVDLYAGEMYCNVMQELGDSFNLLELEDITEEETMDEYQKRIIK